jgi:hypothetical protein
MSIFDLFHSKQKDERKAECPYCHGELKKIPSAKTKCPHCGEFMYVRTRPNDKARVVVTKSEADKIEEDWSIVAGTHDIFIAEKEEFTLERDTLRQRFGGKEPSDNDVRWSILGKRRMIYAGKGDWGLYRNATFQMAEVLRREMKLKQALQMYFEVCLYDLNGANNVSGISSLQLLKEFPPFNPTSAFLAPGVIDLAHQIIKKLNLTKEEIHHIFMEYNSRIERNLSLPVSTEQCWSSIEKEL